MMMDDLLSFVAELIYDVLSGLEGRGSRIEFHGPSLYQFIDGLLRSFHGFGVQRIDDHTLGLRDAVMVFELMDETQEHGTRTSLEELEQRGIHLVASGAQDSAMISFNGTGEEGAIFEGRIVPSRGWVFLIASSREETAAELAQMVDERLGTLDQADD
jgi:hypothetical protein